MKLKFYYLFFFLWSSSLYGIPPIDSLYQLLEQTKTNPQKLLATHLQLADALSKQGDNNKATSHIDTVEKQLTQRNFPIIKVHLLLTKGLLAYNQYKDEEALALFEEGYQLNQKYQAGFCVDFCNNLSKLTSVLVAEDYLNEGLNCASDIQDTIALQEQLGNLYTREEQYEKALVFYNNNQQTAKSIKDTLLESKAYQNIGGVYLIEGKWKKAANSYLESISLKEKISDKQGLTDVHHNLAMVYFKQNQYNKSLEYYQKCADYYNNQQDTAELVEIWSNTASVYIAQQKYEEAATLLNQILALLPQYPNPTIALNTQMNLGDLHLKKENYPEALALFQAAFQAAQQQEDYRSLVTVYNFMGSTYCLLKDYAPSIFYYQEALTLSQELNLLYEQNIALFGLYKSYNALGNPNKALDWYEQYISIKDSLYNVATTNRISELQAEYDNLQKEKAIRELSMANNTIALESALKSKQLYLSLLGSALVLCMVGVLWAYRHQRQKALLHQKQMERLLNEQEIQILTAVVEAQHNEQKRVAREIHDTIGSFLATLMYQHEAGKALAINTPYYKKYLLVEKLIQQTSDEVRILASDMTNGKQLNFNLKIALDELVQRIRSIEKFDLEFNGIGNLLELSSDLEFLLYRVAQELLSNTLKHAQATKVILQINPMPSEVILMVEDDGRGFDPNIPPKGLGLNNIRARIASFNGRLHIDSTLKKGTTAIVTIPID